MPVQALGRIGRLYDGFVAALAGAAAALCVGLSLWVTYDVLLRYFFRQPTSWATDLSEYALLWITFLAGPWLLRHNGHVRVDLLIERLGPRRQRLAGLLSSMIGAAACLILAWQGGETVLDHYRRGTTFAKEWDLPQFVPYAVIPFGAALMSIEFLRGLGRRATEPASESSSRTHRDATI